MALKQLVDVGEKFPTVKRARLGAAPPIEDVLDNVGAPELPPPTPPLDAAFATETSQVSQTDDAPRAKTTPKKKESTARRGGQGIHKGAGTDARRYRKSGRTFPWGVRVHPDMAERVKVMAGEKNVTIGELLEEMEKVYKAIEKIAADKKLTPVAALDDLLKVCKATQAPQRHQATA
jgi:hypothetical protein